VIVYRLCNAAFTALDGEGARLYGGRWNSAGRPMVYTAASPSLALLEVLVHLDLPPELIPDTYRLLTIEVPDDSPTVSLKASPATPADCLSAGDAFLKEAAALALLVPSVIVPQERNALLNPRHDAMGRVRLIADTPFQLDPRLLRPQRA